MPMCTIHGKRLKTGFVFFDFHHQVMEIDEFVAYGEILELWQAQYLMKPMVILDQMCQGSLKNPKKTLHQSQIHQIDRKEFCLRK